MEENKSNVLENQPLVSIIVITYNSAKYVLETLESAKAQTYQNIELIVSDDCSTDITVEICRQWVEENKARFVRTEIITPPHNTGIPANCNRGVKAARGEWVKLIAGDDVLMEEAVYKYLEYVFSNPKTSIVFAFSKRYRDNFNESSFFTQFPSGFPKEFACDSITAKQQYTMLLNSNMVNTPTVFLKRIIISEVGGFDEQIKLLEDYPLWLKLTKAGYKFHFLPAQTVKHRFHKEATDSFFSNKRHKPSRFYNEHFLRVYIYPNIPSTKRINEKYKFLIQKKMDQIGLNNSDQWTKFLEIALIKYLNPFAWLIFILRITRFRAI